MPGLWRNNPETKEGKYPIVLRRDGTPLESRFIVLTLKDPATAKALEAYADAAEEWDMDADYVAAIRELAIDALEECAKDQKLEKPTTDPDAPRHRKDDPAILAWARSIGCPGS
jgi:hypothetical protein